MRGVVFKGNCQSSWRWYPIRRQNQGKWCCRSKLRACAAAIFTSIAVAPRLFCRLSPGTSLAAWSSRRRQASHSPTPPSDPGSWCIIITRAAAVSIADPVGRKFARPSISPSMAMTLAAPMRRS